MSSQPPNDDELDELLDDAFEQFDTSTPQQSSKSQISSEKPASNKSSPPTEATKKADGAALNANFEEEFTRQLSQGMEDLLKETSGANGADSDEMKALLDQLVKQMSSLQADIKPSNSADKDKSVNSSAPAPASELAGFSATEPVVDSAGNEAQGLSFQDKIKATMDKLKESADRADAETESGLGDMDVLDELMRQMDGVGGDAQLDSLVDDVIGQLMSKSVLEQPLKDLDAQYPKYLEKNKEAISKEDYERYQKQHEYVKQILALFDQLDDSSVNDKRVVDLMQKMQEFGQPPSELLKTLAPDIELDEKGEVKEPEPPNCTIM
ncbi:Peroxisome chaperone and import receptor [Coemansia spiralis]|uniref:Peroxisome chaperone and import receptor n=1 Tax=Coemansia spiralis TaxID=417178 RepID=A0A9W8G3S9_9FUNG|nr:Pex19 protein [Coemansia spiralis]KAJ2624796.1 Peroxisome chaperone and import receptor [Coemansia sp. RSA 1358]KAJ2678339.1 Peroxisome chaperone and import receptor [Coemansia spiralis]